jgi:hypothetical protein
VGAHPGAGGRRVDVQAPAQRHQRPGLVHPADGVLVVRAGGVHAPGRAGLAHSPRYLQSIRDSIAMFHATNLTPGSEQPLRSKHRLTIPSVLHVSNLTSPGVTTLASGAAGRVHARGGGAARVVGRVRVGRGGSVRVDGAAQPQHAADARQRAAAGHRGKGGERGGDVSTQPLCVDFIQPQTQLSLCDCATVI